MKLKFLSYALMAAGGLATGSAVAAMPDAGTMLANTCLGCHGPGGSSTGPSTPTIAGMQPESFLEAMKGYKEGTRPATVMDRIVKGYTEDEVKAMAAVFAKQTFVRYPQKVDDKKVAEGKKLHKDHCEKCHVDEGMKDEDGSSVLAGQWLPYLQLRHGGLPGRWARDAEEDEEPGRQGEGERPRRARQPAPVLREQEVREEQT